jgi:hypothetical protein
MGGGGGGAAVADEVEGFVSLVSLPNEVGGLGELIEVEVIDVGLEFLEVFLGEGFDVHEENCKGVGGEWRGGLSSRPGNVVYCSRAAGADMFFFQDDLVWCHFDRDLRGWITCFGVTDDNTFAVMF